MLKEKYPDSIELVGYKCEKGHKRIHNNFKLSETKKTIENYIQNFTQIKIGETIR
tara:strand:+ start:17 stop:181 length:165 start_codon:yes stop_codon:yes gene_type:complete